MQQEMKYNVTVNEPNSARAYIPWNTVMVGDGVVDDRGDVRVKITPDTYLIFCAAKRCVSFQVWSQSHWVGHNARHCKIVLSVEATVDVK
jgi:hypothetical protein